MPTKKRKKQLQHSRAFLLLPGIFLLFGIAFVGLLVKNVYILTSHDSSITGEEAMETTQNKIPDEVLAHVRTQSSVQGAYTFGNYQYILPVELHVPILMYH